MLKDDDEDDAVLLDEVEHRSVHRSFEPKISPCVNCLSLWTVAGKPVSLDQDDGDTILPSTSSKSVVDDVDAERNGGMVIFGLHSDLAGCSNGIGGAIGGLSSVGLLLALVSVLSVLLSINNFECILVVVAVLLQLV